MVRQLSPASNDPDEQPRGTFIVNMNIDTARLLARYRRRRCGRYEPLVAHNADDAVQWLATRAADAGLRVCSILEVDAIRHGDVNNCLERSAP
jgi:hypothetical protein